MTDQVEETQQTTEETAQVEEASEATTETEDSSAEPQKKGVQKRIDELTSNWRNEQRANQELSKDRDHWRDLALKSQSQQQDHPDDAPPKEEDFEDYNEFLKAEARYVVKQEFAAERAANEEKTRALSQQKEAAALQDEFMSKANMARGKYEDFDAVAFNPGVHISESVRDVILRSDKGADIAYYLGKHPEEARRISALPPYLAAAETGKIEHLLSAPKKQTSAPDPVKPLGSGSAQSKDLEDIEDINEWMKRRNQQVRNKQ